MEYKVHLTRVSRNSKTGPIPVSTSEAATCPPTCGQHDTCYAKFGPGMIHWQLVNDGTRSTDWKTFLDEVRRLPRNQLWRHNQAGDLPGDGVTIDAGALKKLVGANKGKRGFTYTHYPLTPENVAAVEAANAQGFTINVSCDTLAQSDALLGKIAAPRVVVLPSTETRKSFFSEVGDRIVVCPATYNERVSCSTCELCFGSSPTRAVIGFPAHGTKKKVIDIRLAA
jgi:hypothetical protein